jgi:hypothetical protein
MYNIAYVDNVSITSRTFDTVTQAMEFAKFLAHRGIQYTFSRQPSAEEEIGERMYLGTREVFNAPALCGESLQPSPFTASFVAQAIRDKKAADERELKPGSSGVVLTGVVGITWDHEAPEILSFPESGDAISVLATLLQNRQVTKLTADLQTQHVTVSDCPHCWGGETWPGKLCSVCDGTAKLFTMNTGRESSAATK